MQEIPHELTTGPFTNARARNLGVSGRMLMGRRFVRVHPRVWRAASHEMSEHDHVAAAELALPHDVHLTGITRIQRAGLDFGPRWPQRFVVAGDHHLALDGIFLHRTKQLPPLDDVGVTPAAAFIAYCARARTIDALKVGDWLVRHEHMSLEVLRTLALAQLWRDGAHEAIWIAAHLSGSSLSLPESDVRAVLTFAGLPAPEVNGRLHLSAGRSVTADLLYRQHRVVVEYEGSQHQEERGQYISDIDRYAAYRDHGIRYVLVTKETLQRPRRVVSEVHRQLIAAGYAGPPPRFADQWELLFMRLSTAVGPRRERAAS